MKRYIIPIFDASPISCELGGEPRVRIRPWSEEVAGLVDFTSQHSRKPDCYAIVPADSKKGALEYLRGSGLSLLQLAIRRPFFPGSAEMITKRQLDSITETSPARLRKGFFIIPWKLQAFLDLANPNFNENELMLKLHGEAHYLFRALELQFVLNMIILENLSNRKENRLESGHEKVQNIDAIKDCIKRNADNRDDYSKLISRLHFNKISLREQIDHYLIVKCGLDFEMVPMDFVDRIVGHRNNIHHGRSLDTKNVMEIITRLEHITKIALVRELLGPGNDHNEFVRPVTNRFGHKAFD